VQNLLLEHPVQTFYKDPVGRDDRASRTRNACVRALRPKLAATARRFCEEPASVPTVYAAVHDLHTQRQKLRDVEIESKQSPASLLAQTLIFPEEGKKKRKRDLW
jgi:hypothetical protein